MARLTPYAFLQEFDNNGDPLSGGKIYTYEAGTTTPKTTYTTAAGDIANPNPVILDSAGRADLWLGSGSYKFILKTSADVTLKTMDNLAGDTANAFGSSVVTISGNLAITSAYKNNVIISTAAATLSLQPAATAENSFYFVIKNTSAAALVTIDPDTAELIDGASTATVRAGQSALVICNGTGWNTIFLDSLNIFADSITTSGATGVVLKNSAGTTVATFGASAGIVSAHAGVVSAVGSIEVAGNATAAAVIALAEDTDNGTNKVFISAPQSIASDYTVILPSAAGTLATVSEVDDAKIQLQTTVAATGSAVNFTSIPSTVKKITVMLVGVSLSGTDNILIQIGDSGGLETTGYSGSAGTLTTGVSTVNLSSGFLVLHSDTAGAISGGVVLQLSGPSTNTWVAHGVVGLSNSPRVSFVGGHKALSATLDRISLVPSGANTFDAGSVNISWEK